MIGRPQLLVGMVWLLFLAPVGQAAADVVHLKNGRSMEGIVLEESAEQVKIRLPFGEIGLPRSSVLEIEWGESALASYLERRESLVQGGAAASDWADLAWWADDNGLDHSCREASLMAARLEPGLSGLAPLMQRHGYAFDEADGIWLPFDELMHRRGYVRSGDRWLSPEEAMAWSRAQEQAQRQRVERQRQDRLARAVEMMALARIAEAEENRRRLEATPRYPVGVPIYGGYSVVLPPRPPHAKPPGHRPRVEHHGSRRSHQERILDRPPGSWIPVSPGETNHGGMQKAAADANPP